MKGDDKEQSPLDLLAQTVLQAKAVREATEEELKRMPRWRFRRRAALRQQLDGRVMKERTLINAVNDWDAQS